MNVTNINSPEQHPAQHEHQQGQHGYYDEDPRRQGVGSQIVGGGGDVNASSGDGSGQGGSGGGAVNNPAVMVATAPAGYYMTPAYPSTIPTLAQQNTQQFSDAMFNSFLAQFGGQRQQQQQGQQGQVQSQSHQGQQQQYATAQYINQFAQSVQSQAPQQHQGHVLQQNQQKHHHQQQQQQQQQPNSQRYFHAAMASAGGPTMFEFQPQFAYAIPPQSSVSMPQQAEAHHQHFLHSNPGVGSRGISSRRMHMQFADSIPAPTAATVTTAAPPQPKKMSTTQSRIEKRKRLKKQGPKRPSSAYFLFSMSIREELLRQYPDAKVPELSKLSSARWKELSEEDKKPFYEQFKDNWEKYRIARKEYEATLPPKRPSGPFIQFTSEMRPKLLKDNPDKSLIEITKLVGEQWRSLPPEEKQKYTDAYKQKLKEWEEFYPDEDSDVIPVVGAATATVGAHGNSTTIPVNTDR